MTNIAIGFVRTVQRINQLMDNEPDEIKRMAYRAVIRDLNRKLNKRR